MLNECPTRVQKRAGLMLGQRIMPHVPDDSSITLTHRYDVLDSNRRVVFCAPNLLSEEGVAAKLLHFLAHLNGLAFKWIRVCVHTPSLAEPQSSHSQYAFNPAVLAQVGEITGQRFGLVTYSLEVDQVQQHSLQQLRTIPHFCRRARKLGMHFKSAEDQPLVVELAVTNTLGRLLGVSRLELDLHEHTQFNSDVIDEIVTVSLHTHLL